MQPSEQRRQSVCNSKASYPSSSQATQAAKRLNKRRGSNNRTVTAYRCDCCRSYHLSSNQNANKRAERLRLKSDESGEENGELEENFEIAG